MSQEADEEDDDQDMFEVKERGRDNHHEGSAFGGERQDGDSIQENRKQLL